MRFEVQDKRLKKKNVRIEFAYIKCFRCNYLCSEKIAPNVIIVSFMFEVDVYFISVSFMLEVALHRRKKKKKGLEKVQNIMQITSKRN